MRLVYAMTGFLVACGGPATVETSEYSNEPRDAGADVCEIGIPSASSQKDSGVTVLACEEPHD